MQPYRQALIVFLAISTFLPVCAKAEEPFRYPEAEHGKGRLQYISGLPVLTIEGTPEEMGDQLGVLALKPARPLTEVVDDYLAKKGWETVYKVVLKTGNILLPRFPPDHLQELNAAAGSSGWPRELLVFGNTISDLRRIVQCSAVIVEAEQSATGGPLFGRNLDWPPIARLHEYTLVVVCRPAGKRAFASITFPGMLGCASGINDAGLALAMLDVTSTKEESRRFNPEGTPTNLLLRRVLEECANIEEAERLLRSSPRASMLNLALCDTKRGAVLEITTKTIAARPSERGVCVCTNHFRDSQLATSTECWRYDALARDLGTQRSAVSDIARRLHAVNQGASTLQTMVFEPSARKLHLAFGAGPASQYPLQTLELSGLFKKQNAPTP
jgi:isopenicillin-N N-acyltransferase like protein